MKKLILFFLIFIPISVQAAQPTFRDRYNSVAQKLAPALVTNECKTSKSIGLNRDGLIECKLVAEGALLTLGTLNNQLTGVLLQVDVNKLEDSTNLMKAGRILLRISRGKDTEDEDRLEMTQIIIESQKHLGKSICKSTPEQNTKFCVTADGKNLYNFGVIKTN